MGHRHGPARGEKDKRVKRGNAPCIYFFDAFGFERQRAIGRPSRSEIRPQQFVIDITQPRHRYLPGVQQRAEKCGKEHDFGKNEPAHTPAERAIDLLVVAAGLAFADDLAKPTEQHVNQHRETESDQ